MDGGKTIDGYTDRSDGERYASLKLAAVVGKVDPLIARA